MRLIKWLFSLFQQELLPGAINSHMRKELGPQYGTDFYARKVGERR